MPARGNSNSGRDALDYRLTRSAHGQVWLHNAYNDFGMNLMNSELMRAAIEAATNAGKFLRENIGHVRSIQQKFGQEKNLVTEIDKRSEEIIISTIKQHFPDHDILAEESGHVQDRGSDHRWIIDPLDGTTNYTHGFPVYCVSIGCEHRGELVLGVIYDPNFNELFSAEKGKGAFLNGRQIHVSRIEMLARSMLITGFPYNITENPNHAVEHFVNFLMKSQAVRRMGSAAIDLAYVAAGRLDGFWEVNLHPWDMAAGAVILGEAGGIVTDFSGKAFSIYAGEILATNGKIHQEMVSVLSSLAEGSPGTVPKG